MFGLVPRMPRPSRRRPWRRLSGGVRRLDVSKRDRIELGVGRLFLIEVARQEADHFVVTELLGPCNQRTVPADLVMLDGLRARDDRHIQHDFVVHFAAA